MNSRKGALLIVGISLLLVIGLVVVFGLVISAMTSGQAAEQPEPPPTDTSTPEIVSPTDTSTPENLSPSVRVTIVPKTERVTSAASTPALKSSPTPTPTPAVASLPSKDTPSLAPAATSVPDDTSVDTPTTHTPTPPQTPLDTPMPSLPPTDTPTPMPITHTPTSSHTSVDTPTATPITHTPTPPHTPTPSPSAPGRIIGRVLLDGVSLEEGVTLRLEDQAYNVVEETRAEADGVYVFDDLPPSSEGYNVLFAQEWNTEYDIDQVISWGWLGPVILEGGAIVELPDLDISLLGFKPLSPEPDATFSAATLSSEDPLTFEWTAYPQAMSYWVDLAYGADQEVIWQSPFVQDTSATFDGTLTDGTSIEPGEYWWGVGARRALGPYTLTVYGYLSGLTLEP